MKNGAEYFVEQHWTLGADRKLHPTLAELQEFFLGRITDTRREIVNEHVKKCDICKACDTALLKMKSFPQEAFRDVVEIHTLLRRQAAMLVINAAETYRRQGGIRPVTIGVPEGFWKDTARGRKIIVTLDENVAITATVSVDGTIAFFFCGTLPGWGEPCLVSPLHPDDDSDQPLMFSLDNGAQVTLPNITTGGILFFAANSEQPLLFSWDWWKGCLERRLIFRTALESREEEVAFSQKVARLPSARF